MMFKQLRAAVATFVVLSVITGVVYPLVVTLIAGAVFPAQAGGSLILDGDQIAGSTLIGQPFDDPKYFWSRPSATSPAPYNAGASSGSNLGPTNPALADAVAQRVAALRAADPVNTAPVPIDLVTASASGLDPHISPAAAEYQAARVARVRGVELEAIRKLVARHTESRLLHLLGEATVNVLALNRDLDALPAR
jgi:potassium-transporting ATPase KdpC subunit